MEVTSSDIGFFAWVAVTSNDEKKSAKFYEELFGWSLETDGDYQTFKKDGKRIAGLVPQDQIDQNGWFGFVAVDDIYKTIGFVESNNGKVELDPVDVGNSNKMAVCVDSGKAPFGLWQAKNHFGAELINEVNTFVWSELLTLDRDKAKEFYNKIFGWKSEVKNSLGYVEFSLKPGMVAGMPAVSTEGLEGQDLDKVSGWIYYFGIEDINTAIETIESNGGKLMQPIEETKAGYFAVVSDPTGAVFGLIQLV